MERTINALEVDIIRNEMFLALSVMHAVIDVVSRLEGDTCKASDMLAGASSYMHSTVDSLSNLVDEAFKQQEGAA